MKLRVEGNLKNRTWVAPFCFSQKGAFLRPKVFKAASLIADRHMYSLVILVLAYIYHGLRLITETSNLIGRIDFSFKPN